MRSRIVNENGRTRCEPCPSGTKAQDNNSICGPDACNTASKRFFITTTGDCYPCG